CPVRARTAVIGDLCGAYASADADTRVKSAQINTTPTTPMRRAVETRRIASSPWVETTATPSEERSGHFHCQRVRGARSQRGCGGLGHPIVISTLRTLLRCEHETDGGCTVRQLLLLDRRRADVVPLRPGLALQGDLLAGPRGLRRAVDLERHVV